jgi:hydrogenase nickel incorporation protein HypA/HybF
MHELSIMQSALELALEQAEQAGAQRICSIRLRVGALSGVVPEALGFAFEVLTAGTTAQGAKLMIEEVPARFWCTTCFEEFEPKELFSDCPRCGNPSGDLRGGRELEVASIEIENGEPVAKCSK